MADQELNHDPAPQPKLLGLLAQFPDADELVDAARKVTDTGLRRVEAYSPFPIHGIDAALKAPKSLLPWFVFCCGSTGCMVGILLTWWTNATEMAVPFSGYAYQISGKPIWSFNANIPVIFELTILFSAFGAFFGMIGFNRLPKLSNPLFRNERFQKVTSSGFSLFVSAEDAKFSEQKSADLLREAGATQVEPCYSEVEGLKLPKGLMTPAAALVLLALVPLFWIAASASGRSELTRRTIWIDMDFQPKLKPQKEAPTTVFADGRAQRVAPTGTVARGSLRADRGYFEGIEPGPMASSGRVSANFVSYQTADGGQAPAPAATPGAAAADPALPPEPNWVKDFPAEVPLSADTVARGRQRFEIHCAACHGQGGFGDGLIAKRAQELQQGTWVPPSSIHSEDVVGQPVGKLFNTISNGVRKMPGYKEHISVPDRWAIVLYLRVLQRSQNAAEKDVPADKLAIIKGLPDADTPAAK